MPLHSKIAGAESTDSQVLLRWSVHLAKERPGRTLLCGVATALAMVAGYHAVGMLGPIAAAAVMLGSLSEFLFPVTYEITRERASCRMFCKSAEIRWDKVRQCYVDEFGIKLSPVAPGSRLEAFRGVYLRFGDNREQLTDMIRSLRSERCME